MSDEGEKFCPLCAEEMDLTDQQLRPCKCGYEICVWCWHHIMDMAEKDETEGRCPACRTPYNKEKIVGTTAKCKRRVSEMTAEKKLKSQKGNTKILEGRKQLGSARVIQRNLVYVVGVPLNFVDEDLLQRREYFGQYGKVLKVSISRTTTGSIQQVANRTCSVYITYSREEEAVRCIQMVHGFTLDGRPLRACFGTTKYCHAWLRNVPCTNPDCLYLHEIGSQEDSFTKDEVISSHTRSRIQQVTSSSNSIQRRSGNVLPPPEDGTPIVKSAMYTNHNSATSGRTSPPNSSSGRSATLPAGSSWGTRPCSSQPLQTSSPSSNGPLDQITDTCDSPVAFSKAVTSQVYSLQNGTGKKNVPKEESTISQVKSKPEAFGSFKKESDADGNIVSDTSMNSVNAIVPLSSELHSPRRTKSLLNTSNICDSPATSSGLASKYNTDNGLENVCSDTLSLNIEENQHLQNDDVEHIREPSICRTPEEVKNNTDAVHIASVQSDSISGRTDQLTEVYLPELDDLLSFHKQRIKDPEIACSRAPDFSDAFNITHSDFDSPVFGNANVLIGNGFHRQVVDRSINLIVSTSNRDNIFNNGAEDSNLFLGKQKMSPVGGHDPEEGSGAIDIGESSIISSILSMDFDSWDVPVTSPQNLAKFLGETNRRRGSLGETGSSITQNSGGSRFSFAREEAIGHLHSEQSADHEHSFNHHLFGHNYSSSNRLHPEKSVSSNRLHLEKSVSTNGLHDFSALEQDGLATNHSHITSNKLSVPRPQVSAPPGFSVSSRAAPPGFNTHGKTEQVVKSHSVLSGNYAFDTLLRNQYQIPSGGDTYTNGDTEFMDPAILAVGKGTFASGIDITGLDIIPNFPPQFNTFDEATLRSILQRSMPSHDNQRFSGLGDGLSTLGDAYGISSRIVEQTLSNNASPFSQFTIPQSRNGISSNGQWDGWNEAWGVNHLGVAELLRSERLGFNDKYFSEESRMRMSGSCNIYNATYGI